MRPAVEAGRDLGHKVQRTMRYGTEERGTRALQIAELSQWGEKKAARRKRILKPAVKPHPGPECDGVADGMMMSGCNSATGLLFRVGAGEMELGVYSAILVARNTGRRLVRVGFR